MEKLFNWVSIIIAAIGGFLAKIYGGVDGILITLIILVIADYITGVIKAIINKKLSSEIGAKGIAKKILIFVVVGMASVLQIYIITEAIPLREITIMFYLANEGISLLENAAEFIPIPQKLKDILLQLRDKNETAQIAVETDNKGREI